MTRDPHRLDVFHLAHRLALDTYRVTTSLPEGERYGLQSQMRRAAVSIPANIVEGCARRSAKDYMRFLEIAQGSASELWYLGTLSVDLGLLTQADAMPLVDAADHVARARSRLRDAATQFSDG